MDCKTGKPCGCACIPVRRDCRKEGPCEEDRRCAKGKPCGKSCINADRDCKKNERKAQKQIAKKKPPPKMKKPLPQPEINCSSGVCKRVLRNPRIFSSMRDYCARASSATLRKYIKDNNKTPEECSLREQCLSMVTPDPCEGLKPPARLRIEPQRDTFTNKESYEAAMMKYKRYGHWGSTKRCPVLLECDNREYPQDPAPIPVKESKAIKKIKSKEELTMARREERMIVKVKASWCGPCNSSHPLYIKLAKEIPSSQFYTVDVDEAPGVAEMLKARVLPTFIIFRNGRRSASLEGLTGLSEFIRSNLKSKSIS